MWVLSYERFNKQRNKNYQLESPEQTSGEERVFSFNLKSLIEYHQLKLKETAFCSDD